MPTTTKLAHAKDGTLSVEKLFELSERESGAFGLADDGVRQRFRQLVDWINARGPYSAHEIDGMRQQLTRLLTHQIAHRTRPSPIPGHHKGSHRSSDLRRRPAALRHDAAALHACRGSGRACAASLARAHTLAAARRRPGLQGTHRVRTARGRATSSISCPACCRCIRTGTTARRRSSRTRSSSRSISAMRTRRCCIECRRSTS